MKSKKVVSRSGVQEEGKRERWVRGYKLAEILDKPVNSFNVQYEQHR